MKPPMQEVAALLRTAARAMTTTGRRHGKTYTLRALEVGRGPAAEAVYVDEVPAPSADTALAKEILAGFTPGPPLQLKPQRMQLRCAGKTRAPLGGRLPCPSNVTYTAVYGDGLPADVAEAMRTAGWRIRRGVRTPLVWHCPNAHEETRT